MNDTEINDLIIKLPTDLVRYFSIRYISPSIAGGGHHVEIESKTCLGTISIWPAGSMDWHIFNVDSSNENILGHCEVKDTNAILDALFIIFKKIKIYDIGVDR